MFARVQLLFLGCIMALTRVCCLYCEESTKLKKIPMSLMPKLKPGDETDAKGRRVIWTTELQAPHYLCDDHHKQKVVQLRRSYTNNTNRQLYYFGEEECTRWMEEHADLMKVHGLSITTNVDETLFMARPSYFKDGNITMFETAKHAYKAVGIPLESTTRAGRRRKWNQARGHTDSEQVPVLGTVSLNGPRSKKAKKDGHDISHLLPAIAAIPDADIECKENAVANRQSDGRNRRKKKRRTPSHYVVKRGKVMRYNRKEAMFYLNFLIRNPHGDVQGLESFIRDSMANEEAQRKDLPKRSPGALTELYVFISLCPP